MSDKSTVSRVNKNDSQVKGILNDDHECSKKARIYANKVINGNKWDICDIDLNRVHFETCTRTKKRHGRATYKSDKEIIKMSEHTYNNTVWYEYRETVRHELIHVWQKQHEGETKEVNGVIYDDISAGHTGCWYDWEDIMNVSRINHYYDKTKDDYRYILKCPLCDDWIGKHKMSKKVKKIATTGTWYHNCSQNKKSDVLTYRILVNPDETHMLRLDSIIHWSNLKERDKNKIRDFADGLKIPYEAEKL